MNYKNNKFHSAKNSPRHSENMIEDSNLQFFYQNTPNHHKDKESGVSSDEETTSSSLIPLPDSLKRMKIEFRKTIRNVEESSDIDSPFNEDSARKFSDSLHELRKKYIIRNENSVATKVNSANIMLDDILNSNNFKKVEKENLHEKESFVNTNHKMDNSNDSLLSINSCGHLPFEPTLPSSTISGDLSKLNCPTHGNNFQLVCDCNNLTLSSKKFSRIPEHNLIEKRKKILFMQKIKNLHKFGIQSLYKMMDRKKFFNKEKKSTMFVDTQQGIPGATNENNQVFFSCDCVRNTPEKQFRKRMIPFDLLEPNYSLQLNSESLKKQKEQCFSSSEINCTCPEVIPSCICAECTCKTLSLTRKNLSLRNPPQPEKMNEYAQTDIKLHDQYSALEKTEMALNSEDQEKNDKPKEKETNIGPKLYKDKKRNCYKERKLVERTDIYYFDHGNSAYYQTTDNHPVRYTECLVDRTDEYATKFWAEFFGAIEIGISFLVSFILQLYRFLFTSIIRSLTVGLLQIFSDYFFKPLLTITFNGIIQPCLILVYNTSTSLRDLCLPVSQIFGFFAKEISNIFRACRVVEVHRDMCKQTPCYCGNKV